ncbi:MAG: hypothetical protein JSW00_15580 [Thermoplasmata archaeon]|nr:MAG: hypothetical protein JSW00_15580 [Thermoplasmata archaeon]
MVLGIVLIVVLMLTAVFAGCVSEDIEPENGNSKETEDQPDADEVPDDTDEVPDEGDGNESEPPETDGAEAEGTTGAEGTVEALAQASPETVTETLELHIPEDKITGVDFVIRVEDGDEETNPDEVSGSIDSTDGYTEPLPKGQTPYSKTIAIKPPKGQYLPEDWIITLEVVCHASDDQWPGPLMWVGSPDNGFSYNVSATYKYLI